MVVFFVSVGVYLKLNYVGYRNNSPFEEAHARAIQTFVDERGFGIGRMKEKEYWNDSSVVIGNDFYDVESVQLIGATEDYGLRYYTARYPSKKKEMSSKEFREPSLEEQSALNSLKTGGVFFVKSEVKAGEIIYGEDTRVIAPLFARESCLKCHEVEVGDLLGAFDYRLTKVED